jgi:Rad3-related DNA helicase
MDAAIPRIASGVSRLLKEHKSCGVVHCTYSMAQELREHLSDPRLMWHTRADKAEVYQEFLASPPSEGKVLVASGMYEGLDLSYDLARWQCICKVPYVSLAEPVIKERLKERPESYAWWAVRSIIQATGRVCRTPTDYGWTYMLDGNFTRLYKENPGLFPDWFKHAVRNVSEGLTK